jgi:hypothetical protein
MGMLYNSISLDKFCKMYGFVGWFETSAKSHININGLLLLFIIISTILKNQ